MLNRVLLVVSAGMIAFGASAFTAPTSAEAHHRHGYSGGGIYFQFGHAPRYHRHAPRRHYRYYDHRPRYYRHHRPKYYRHYQPRRSSRYERHCYRVERWARANTSDPKMQARILRQNGC